MFVIRLIPLAIEEIIIERWEIDLSPGIFAIPFMPFNTCELISICY